MLRWLNTQTPEFPPSESALPEPNGLLAAGGQLSTEWLLAAYSRGIFPWFNPGDPILWWSPSPRMVFYLDQFHISRSLRKTLKRSDYKVTINQAFEQVITACAEPRQGETDQPATWISPAMNEAYVDFHKAGYAHSAELWQEGQLVGGLYGVALGKVFFGESMFSRVSNGSKIALAYLVEYLRQWQYALIDCQIYNDHLRNLGAVEIPRSEFEELIFRYTKEPNENDIWTPKELRMLFNNKF